MKYKIGQVLARKRSTATAIITDISNEIIMCVQNSCSEMNFNTSQVITRIPSQLDIYWYVIEDVVAKKRLTHLPRWI